MKDSSEYGARLKRLCNRLKREEVVVAPELDEYDVTTTMIVACLSQYTTESKARTALKKLRYEFVDFNEVRVSRADDVAEVLGKNFSHGKEVAQQIISLLREIFELQDSLELEKLRDMGKREAKNFLEKLESSSPYVISRVMLCALGAHAFPVHDQLLEMLREEEVINPSSDAADVQGFLERHLSVKTVKKTYDLLRAYADGFKPKRAAARKKAAEKKSANREK